jgi:hypothetical protein
MFPRCKIHVTPPQPQATIQHHGGRPFRSVAPYSPRGKTGPPAHGWREGVGRGSSVSCESTVHHSGWPMRWSRTHRRRHPDRLRTCFGAIKSRGSEVAPIGTAVRRPIARRCNVAVSATNQVRPLEWMRCRNRGVAHLGRCRSDIRDRYDPHRQLSSRVPSSACPSSYTHAVLLVRNRHLSLVPPAAGYRNRMRKMTSPDVRQHKEAPSECAAANV